MQQSEEHKQQVRDARTQAARAPDTLSGISEYFLNQGKADTAFETQNKLTTLLNSAWIVFDDQESIQPTNVSEFNELRLMIGVKNKEILASLDSATLKSFLELLKVGPRSRLTMDLACVLRCLVCCFPMFSLLFPDV